MTTTKEVPRAAVEGSPEFFLRWRAPGVHRLVVLVHEKQKGKVRGMRKSVRKLMEQVEEHGESCTHRNLGFDGVGSAASRDRNGMAWWLW